MRTVKLGTTEIEVKALTGTQIKELRMAGVPISRFTFDLDKLRRDEAVAEKAFDMIMGYVLPVEFLGRMDDFGNDEILAVWNGVLNETFGVRDEEKN